MNREFEDMLAEMTLVEKASFLAGADMWHTVALERLGIPAIGVSDGPNGARGREDIEGSTSICFPVGVAMGATWNPELIEQVGKSLAAEIRAKDAHVLLAPTVNIQRTPIAGRNFECFAEDPFLSGTIASAYINGLQQHGVAACIKHFVANDQEHQRFSISSEVAERPLHEIYLEPFRIAIHKANPWSVMSAYNRVNGTYASEHNGLLLDLLKGKWNYDGLVMSDWYGTYGQRTPAGGLDLEMPGPARWMDPTVIVARVESGELEETHIDDKVRRLLRLIDRVSEKPDVPPADDTLPRRVATQAIVLLKNENDLLPLDPEKPQQIVVIGENARWAQIMGGGSSQVSSHYAVSPLEGIQQRVSDTVTVNYQVGAYTHQQPPPIKLEWLTSLDGRPGLTLDYYQNLELAGKPAHSGLLRGSEITWFGSVNRFVDPSHFSMRLRGTVAVPESGNYEMHLFSIGQARLMVDGALQIDHWDDRGEQQTAATVSLETGRDIPLQIDYVTDPGSRWRILRLGCLAPFPADRIQAAVDLAASADVVIVVAGLTREWESEGHDRADMKLVGEQDELISRVAATNPNTVVVLNVGSPVEMPWLEAVPAVLQSWYAGQDAGHALADLLFGDVNPSGKLPTTFPRRLQDNPAYINYPGENGQVHYGEGIWVGYRYFDKKEIEPLFPFGHGLSYTTFAYSDLCINREQFGPGDEIVVQVKVTNTGVRTGREVVQLYLRDEDARLVRPLQELKAFSHVTLEPSETRTVALTLDQQSLSFYDPAAGAWVTEPGEYVVLVGTSSRDIRLRGRFTWVDESFETVKELGDPRQLSTVAT